MHNPILYNTLENAGYNAAETVWKGAELFTHYLSPFALYAGYKALSSGASVVKWAFSAPASTPAPVEPAPAPRGRLMSLIIGGTSLTWWATKKLVALSGLAYLSHFIHENYLRVGLWEDYRGLGVAFLRPIMEKILPMLYTLFDKGDINLNARSLVFGASTRAEKYIVTNVAYGVRDLFVNAVYGCSSAFEVKAYELGQNAANTLEAVAVLAGDVIVGSSHIGTCLQRAPHTNFQCMRDAANYFGERFQGIYEMSAPIRAALNEGKEAALAWGEVGLAIARDAAAVGLATTIECAQVGARFAVDYGDQALWNIAASVEESTGVPAAITHGAELVTLAGAGLFTAYKTGQFMYNWAIPEAARNFVSRLWTRPTDVGIHADVNVHLPPPGSPRR